MSDKDPRAVYNAIVRERWDRIAKCNVVAVKASPRPRLRRFQAWAHSAWLWFRRLIGLSAPDFRCNVLRIRCEQRAALAIYRPAASRAVGELTHLES